MNITELQTAAERLNARERSLANPEMGHLQRMREIYLHRVYTDMAIDAAVSTDEMNLARWARMLLSTDPLTPEWLREKWEIDTLSDVQVLIRGRNELPMLLNQGQFTALMFSLGRYPKEG